MMPFHAASNLRKNVLAKSGSTNTRVVHIVSFKAWKDWSTTSVQLKSFLLRRCMRRAIIFP
jgi:hypothetical protein